MKKATLLRKLMRRHDGVAAVEFGLLGALLIAMMLGVMQIGMAMQRYNALRSIADDVSRYAVVQYQSDNEITNEQIQEYGRSLALAAPYFVEGEGLKVTVTTPDTQRVSGALERELTIRAQVNLVTGILGVNSFYIAYSRPIFVLNE